MRFGITSLSDPLTRIQRSVLLVAALLCLTALSISGRAWFISAKTAVTARAAEKAKAVAGISVNLTRFGFEPAEITIPKGGYYVSVRNLTERNDITLALARSNNQKLVEEPYKNGSRGWDRLLKLTPGDYVLSEKANPRWTLKIKVTPN